MKLSVFVAPGIGREKILPLLTGDQEITESLDPSQSIFFIVDDSFLQTESGITRSAAGIFWVLKNDAEAKIIPTMNDVPVDYCIGEVDPIKVRNLLQTVMLTQQVQKMREERDSHSRRLKELNNIGIALSTEKDPNKLLNMILQKSREITCADAGSLYLVEGDAEFTKRLRFKISQNDSMEVPYEEFVMPITKGSVAGYVAATGESLNIPDVYKIRPDQEYHFNRHFDESSGYHTTSTLAVPMRNHKGEIIGIIQLINRKKDYSIKLNRENFLTQIQPFDKNDEELVSSLASQAAVALENSMLIKSIERLFEGFVTASVTAIESRDPTTSGHSFRVADLTVGLAQTVDGIDSGKFKDVKFTNDELKEVRYASLLHDFGKVGVRENVLVKAKKLYPMQVDLIRERFGHFKSAWEAEYYKSKLNMLLNVGSQEYDTQTRELDFVYRNRLSKLEDYWKFIEESNEPSLLAEGNFERLLRISAESDLVPPGIESALLTSDEVQLLSIRKGSLNDRERVEIESHVTHTFLFLSKIPWTSELRRVPRIAYGHHEKLNGSGYPNRLKAEEIPVQTRMMTISDIYDALTASDRPYKRAVPSERALEIIASEVQTEQIDHDLFQVFLDAKIYKTTATR